MDQARKDRIAALPTKSLSEIRARFCQLWRSDKTDEQFLAFMREITADAAHMPYNHRLNHCRNLMILSVGDEWYEINTDTCYRLVE